MEGKIFGIPLLLILLVVIIAALVDVPTALFNRTTQARISSLEYGVLDTNLAVHKLLVTPTIEPTATPSATPTTAVKAVKPVTTVQVK